MGRKVHAWGAPRQGSCWLRGAGRTRREPLSLLAHSQASGHGESLFPRGSISERNGVCSAGHRRMESTLCSAFKDH